MKTNNGTSWSKDKYHIRNLYELLPNDEYFQNLEHSIVIIKWRLTRFSWFDLFWSGLPEGAAEELEKPYIKLQADTIFQVKKYSIF